MGMIWTFVATGLYCEILVAIILMLPWIPCERWQKLFKSRFLMIITSYANYYFTVFIVILMVVFGDAIREVYKYSGEEKMLDPKTTHHDTLEHIQLRLFRSQRNLYIAGFALFLWLVLKRLVVLISAAATLTAQRDVALKQAENTSAHAKKLMEEADTKKANKDNEEKDEERKRTSSASDKLEEELKRVKEDLEKSESELEQSKRDLQTLKKQASATNNEYDRLLKEHAELQAKLESGGEDKKDL
ncbi:B-cell receptor-associated protein 31 isoform X3 [Lingula anatina]|uniref:Endoplasmic reticulum transmembrane protein n=1 Tax=Lingula anatina TaxID=7574 RepID=A0A1S3JN94_LINAN|nr:B-cell receptor-associated protein 31 isoform X3 [Lingula anatina]|eukprot:XP_013411830.1 B-cell receptor-associated protein 31 isoform X3 [Lingula anatina]